MAQISNMLAKIMNAQAVEKETVSVPCSKIKLQLAKLLQTEKFVKNAEQKGKKNKTIEIELAYREGGEPVIRRLKRVSKSSQRVYLPFKKLLTVRHIGPGFKVVSTSKGIMTEKEAIKEKVGGEIICEVW